MSRILAISGSLRKGSHNTALLRALPPLLPAGMELTHYGDLSEVPLYNADLDTARGGPIAPRDRRRGRPDPRRPGVPARRSRRGEERHRLGFPAFTAPALAGKAVLVLVATTGRTSGFCSLADTAQVLAGPRNIVVPVPEVAVQDVERAFHAAADGTPSLAAPATRALIGVQPAMLGDLVNSGAPALPESSFQRRTAEFLQIPEAPVGIREEGSVDRPKGCRPAAPN